MEPSTIVAFIFTQYGKSIEFNITAEAINMSSKSPLRKRYNPQLHSTWPYITLTSKYLCL